MNPGLVLLIALAATAPAARVSGPPTVDGVFVDKGACPGEGCYMGGPIQAAAPVPLYSAPSPTARVIGKLAADEWVTPAETQMRLTPARGVVRKVQGQGKALRKGEIVYRLTSQGEGCFDLWRRGATITWCDPEAMGPEYAEIAWDARPANAPEDAFWVRIKRAPNGKSAGEGWIKDFGDIHCGGLQDREGCPPLKP